MMKTQEVAALLDRSIEQIRRYHKQGLLVATQNGRELLFDRDAVLEFARTRGIRTAEREAPQGDPFPRPPLTVKEICNEAPPNWEVVFRPILATARA